MAAARRASSARRRRDLCSRARLLARRALLCESQLFERVRVVPVRGLRVRLDLRPAAATCASETFSSPTNTRPNSRAMDATAASTLKVTFLPIKRAQASRDACARLVARGARRPPRVDKQTRACGGAFARSRPRRVAEKVPPARRRARRYGKNSRRKKTCVASAGGTEKKKGSRGSRGRDADSARGALPSGATRRLRPRSASEGDACRLLRRRRFQPSRGDRGTRSQRQWVGRAARAIRRARKDRPADRDLTQRSDGNAARRVERHGRVRVPGRCRRIQAHCHRWVRP